MATKPRIFISAVSAEFRQTRQMIAQVLLRLGYDPFWQDILSTEAGDLREMLQEKIDSCDGVLQIVGYAYGYEPEKIDLDYGRISYTQFELAYARKIGKKSWVVFAGDDCTRDTPIEELNLPPEDDHPDPAGYQAERRKLQAAWREKLKRTGDLHHEASNDTQLELRIERMKDELQELLRSERLWKRLILGGIAAVVLLAATAVGMIGSIKDNPGGGIPFDEISQDDLRPEIKSFESLTDHLRWSVQINQPAPVAKTFQTESPKVFYSLDGQSYEEGMSYGWISVANAGESNRLFLKYVDFEGDEIGPFEYEIDFRKFALDQSRAELEKKSDWIKHWGGAKSWRWNTVLARHLAPLERIEYAFVPSFADKKTLEIPQVSFREYFNWRWANSVQFINQPIMASNENTTTLYYRFVYRNGETGKIHQSTLQPLGNRYNGFQSGRSNQVAFEELKKDDLTLQQLRYEPGFGSWNVFLKMPSGIPHYGRDRTNGVKVDYSFDGETFHSASNDSFYIQDKRAVDSKKLVLKLTSQSGDVAGPFEYEADFRGTILEHMEKNLKQQIEQALRGYGNNMILRDSVNWIGLGFVVEKSLPLISKIEFSFDKSMKDKTTIVVPEGKLSDFQNSQWRKQHKLSETYDKPKGIDKVYTVITFRDGTKSKVIEQDILKLGGGGGLGGGN